MLKENCQLAMSGQRTTVGYTEKALTTHFELLNLVPDNQQGHGHRSSKSFYTQRQFDSQETRGAQSHSDDDRDDDDANARSNERGGGGGDASNDRGRDDGRAHPPPPTKWRRVGLVSGRNVHLDTIVWPGGDIVVSGLSARARSVFRVVTALAPPFVMESELDEDGLCLRGLPCHRLAPTGMCAILLPRIRDVRAFKQRVASVTGQLQCALSSVSFRPCASDFVSPSSPVACRFAPLRTPKND